MEIHQIRMGGKSNERNQQISCVCVLCARLKLGKNSTHRLVGTSNPHTKKKLCPQEIEQKYGNQFFIYKNINFYVFSSRFIEETTTTSATKLLLINQQSVCNSSDNCRAKSISDDYENPEFILKEPNDDGDDDNDEESHYSTNIGICCCRVSQSSSRK